MPNQTFILIGYRGSGKTQVGRRLAGVLGLSFVDVDDEIVRRFDGLTIRDIWGQHGEPAFRQSEVAVTRELCAGDPAVIALGGGTLSQRQARAAVDGAPRAVRVYLKADPAVLLERIQADHKTNQARPDLTALGGGIEEIRNMLAEREPIYQAVADVEIDVSRLTVDQVVDRLASMQA